MEHPPQHPVPVFPLPGTVLFPRAVLPLHIFELRYRTMVRDALSQGRMIAMALLKPGWERDYHGSPAFFETGCLGRIERVAWLPNDCYDLELAGLVRVRFTRVVKEFPYRAARLEPVPEHPVPQDDPLVQLELSALRSAWTRFAAVRYPGAAAAIAGAVPAGGTLEETVNRLCTALDMPADEKLALLETDSLLERSQRTRAWLERALRAARAPDPPAGGEDGALN